jgi:hypothetical protein
VLTQIEFAAMFSSGEKMASWKIIPIRSAAASFTLDRALLSE